MIRKVSLFILLMLFSAPALAAQECMSSFYQTKNMECVDTILEKVNASADQWVKNPRSFPAAVVGFLAQVFIDYPEKRKQVLTQDISKNVEMIYEAALVKAGLYKEAENYANKIGWPGYQKYRSANPQTLGEIKPRNNPADNDLLIGAYGASGNTDYIRKILDNFTSVDDGIVHDAMRIALMEGKFGPRLTPPGRQNIMAPAICEKYECKNNLNDFMHVMTLASAIWAARSISVQDEGVKNTLNTFFDDNPRLKRIMAIEQTAFGNYVTAVVAYSAIKNNPNINRSLEIYEKLGPAEDAAKAWMNK